MVNALSPSLAEYSGRLCPQIEAALGDCTELPPGCPPKLAEAMRYSLLAPGKRLRPMLALLAAEACGGDVQAAMPAACAVEMVHAYSLVHDDLPAMDNDDLRRGRPTCHKVFGEALAILAGDALLTLAFQTLAEGLRPPETAAAACAALAAAAGACQLVGGQADDVTGAGIMRGATAGLPSSVSENTAGQASSGAQRSTTGKSPVFHPEHGQDARAALESIHSRKTGAMIRVSLRLGAMAVGAADDQLAALDEYGRRLGLAFQITDDLLERPRNEAAAGKRVGKDAARGKLTFPGLLGVDRSDQCARELVDEACRALLPLGRAGCRPGSVGPLRPRKESLMDKLLSTINSPEDLRGLSAKELEQLAHEMREAICRLAATRTAHFASNLGVVELTLALHTSFDFRRDRLVWDTGHQVYPHKLITGRYDEFHTMRAKGGLMGYPNPAESDYDLFMTGHAGCSVATALGVKCGDDLVQPDPQRRVVAVIGDGAFSSGIVLEAMNHAGGLKKNLIVVLNDNKMSICPRVGGLAESLDRLRTNTFYTGLKTEVQRLLNRVPVIGDPVERFLNQVKGAIKAGLVGGMFFEELGFRYVGPVDGHNIRQLQKYLAMVRQVAAPVLLHVVTEKGHGFQPAAEDPTSFHTPEPFRGRTGPR